MSENKSSNLTSNLITKDANLKSALFSLKSAQNALNRGNSQRVVDLCKKALSLCPKDSEICAKARSLMSYSIPGYHLAMMNDSRRNEVWDEALRRIISPGMKVLEIGTGAGMLAMMAARAGAMVTTCEYHEVVANLAREIVELNGLSDRIQVHSKNSYALRIGKDMEERADLLFCDNFSDNFFSFDPLGSIADARRRLLKPDVPCLPALGSVHLALGNWSRYSRFCQATEACGFDISPAAVFAAESKDLELGDPQVTLLSEGEQAFLFDFQGTTFPKTDKVEVDLNASQDCTVTGIIQWIRLGLGGDLFVDSRPNLGQEFFSNPRFHALSSPQNLKAGESLRVNALHDGHHFGVWV